MALPLTVKTLDDLPEALREHYVPNPFHEFELDIDGAGPLRNAHAHLKRERQSMRSKIVELEIQLADLRSNKPSPKPEDQMNAKEKFFYDAEQRLAQLPHGSPEYQAELAKIESEMDPIIEAEAAAKQDEIVQHIEGLKQQIRKETIKQAANSLAGELARPGSSEALLPHVLARLDCEEQDDEVVVFVKDAAGKRSALSVEDLKAEFRSTPAFSPIIRDAGANDGEAHRRKVAAMLGQRNR